jgi:uncharacterized protein YjbI with pentapeptide repeats
MRRKPMADEKQLEQLKNSVAGWNEWRKVNRDVEVDLSGANLTDANLMKADLRGALFDRANLSRADLSGADLRQAYLSRADLSKADLSRANLSRANLSGADLSGAILIEATLRQANLSGADLSKAILIEADLNEAILSGANLIEANLIEAILNRAKLIKADLSRANLSGANLRGSIMIQTDCSGANLTGCNVYGLSAWDLILTKSTQLDLIITPEDTPTVVVDNIEVAQFVYLLLNNKKIRDIIDTIGDKGVLILGRFTEERKAVLDAIRNELRELGFVPMMFDFEKPTQRDFTETIMTLAGMSRFIIADITNPKSSPLELQATVPNYMVPFVPIIQEGEKPFSMFKDLYGKYDWVLKPLEYDTAENLIEKLEKGIINRALEKHKELMLRKAMELQTVKLEDL